MSHDNDKKEKVVCESVKLTYVELPFFWSFGRKVSSSWGGGPVYSWNGMYNWCYYDR